MRSLAEDAKATRLSFADTDPGEDELFGQTVSGHGSLVTVSPLTRVVVSVRRLCTNTLSPMAPGRGERPALLKSTALPSSEITEIAW